MSVAWRSAVGGAALSVVLPGLHTEAVCVRLCRYAGHTVVLSGVTLIIAYLALLFFPVKFIQVRAVCGNGCARVRTLSLISLSLSLLVHL